MRQSLLATQSKKQQNGKILLLGFPGNGLIGTFTISYLISHLKMKMIGEVNHPDLPPALFVDNGEIIGPIRIYKKENIYAIISDMPIYPEIAYDFVGSVAEFCKKNQIDKVIVPSGIDTPEADQNKAKTYGLVTDVSLEKMLYENDIPKFLAGAIIGTDAALITTLRSYKIPLLLLYTGCHPFFPDPQAAVYAITVLAKVLKVQVDTTDIQKRIDYLKIQHRNLMKETLEALQQQEKQIPARVPPIYR